MIETLNSPSTQARTNPNTTRAAGSPAGSNVRRSVRPDGICVLTFDRPDSSANIFDRRTLIDLDDHLHFIEGAPHIKGVIITSAKPSIFIAGADLKSMSEASPDEVAELIDLGQSVMSRLAALPIPTAAAVHGAAVGGGYELCLACDYRVASTDRATKLGLPEVQLGLIPAWGGSTRLPRLVGVPSALNVILAGKTPAARSALKLGLVDELAPAEYIVEVAARLLSSGKPPRKRFPARNNSLVARIIAARLRPGLIQKTRGHYPAVLKALDVVTRGIARTENESLELERSAILELIRGDVCRNLIRVFLLQERAKKLFASREPTKPVALAAVVGSGVMGAGIAQWISARKIPVVLRDINADQLAKGLSAISKIYRDAARRHVFTTVEVREGLDRIHPAPNEVPLRSIDVVIEAAVEKLELKKAIFARLDELASADALLATNTSALPISELAAATRHPERVVGLHFFNPVHRMQLVEVVAGPMTSSGSVLRAVRFVQQLGKLPVIVRDSPGFLVNRILMPYLVEAGTLFEAGVAARDLDEAMLEFGMPMGPMTLLDEVGIDVAMHVARTLASHYSDRMRVPPLLNRMVDAGFLGRKSGRGFYAHGGSGPPDPNYATEQFRIPAGLRLPGRAEAMERMVLLMINEAARCVEEKVVAEPADVDFAMIMGTGFAPFRGGPLRHADAIGADVLVDRMNRLRLSGEPRFTPCALLQSMAGNGGQFYKQAR